MAITFHCLCGKRLKAHESSAGKRTKCPGCGEPVGIPASSAPAAPPVSRKEAADAATSADGSSNVPKNAASEAPRSGIVKPTPVPYFMMDEPLPVARPIRKPKKPTGPASPGLPVGTKPGAAAEAASKTLSDEERSGLELRTPPKWYRLISRGEYRGPSVTHELGYSLGNAPLVLLLAVLLTLPLGVGGIQLPDAMQAIENSMAVVAIAALVLLGTLAHVASFLCQTIRNAACQLGDSIDLKPATTAKVTLAILSAVIAGPILPGLGTFFYWLRIGVDEPVDWILLIELAWLMAFWLTASILSYSFHVEVSAVLPHRVFQVASTIPGVIAIRSLIFASLLVATAGGVGFAMMQIHTETFLGFVVLAAIIPTSLTIAVITASSLGKAAVSLAPKKKARVDSKAEAFEQELQATT